MANEEANKKLAEAVDYDALSKPLHLLAAERWPLIPTCVWIATRNESAAALAWDDDRARAQTGLQLMRSYGNLPTGPSVDQGWEQLANEMTNGRIDAFATRVAIKGPINGVWRNTTGVRFPPPEQLGAALGYELNDRDEQPGLAPRGSAGAFSVVEFREVTLLRDKIMELWPVPAANVGSTEPLGDAHAAPVASSPEHPSIQSTDTAEIEHAYAERREELLKQGRKSSRDDDWAFLQTIKPDITRDRSREIREKLAPAEWQAQGRRSAKLAK